MKRILAHTAWYALATLAVRAMPLVTLPVLTHALAPAEYGRLEALVVLAELGGLVAGGGLAAVVFRFAASGELSEKRQAAADVIGLALLVAGCCALLGCLATPVLVGAGLIGGASAAELAIATVSFCLAAFVETPLAVLRTEDRSRTYTFATILRAVVQTALLVGLLAAGAGVAGALSAGAITSAALACWLLLDRRGRGGVRLPDRARFKRYARYGLPMLAAGIVGFAQMAGDRWVVAHALGLEAMAVYALAVKVAIVAALLLRPYDMWWESNRMRLMTGANDRKAVQRAQAAGFVLAAISGVASAVLGAALIRFAIPDAFHGALALVPLAAAAGAIHAASAYAAPALYTRASGVPVFLVNLVCALVTLLACFLIVPRFGVEGALSVRLAGAILRVIGFYAIAALLAARSERQPAESQTLMFEAG